MGLLDQINKVTGYHVQGYKPMNQQMGLLSAAMPSPYGDAVGLLADVGGYAENPESLTPARGLLSLAALAPGIPAVSSKIPKGLKLSDELTAAYSGQQNLTSRAMLDGKQVGYLDWTVYQGEPQISMIEVLPEFRKKGIGRALVERIKALHPDADIDPGGYSTKDGQEFMRKLGLKSRYD